MLNKILETKKEEIKHLKLPNKMKVKHVSLKEALLHDPEQVQVLAEVKKASPSKGLIRENFHPAEIAAAYERGGAAALSILTDEKYFQGSRNYLMYVKQLVSLPVLRKDFIIDKIQVEESARMGADAILLIAAALSPTELYTLYKEAVDQGMEVLVEFHSQLEIEQVFEVFEPEIAGINNRDLHTFETSLEVTASLSSFIPQNCVLVSESGIYTKEDVEKVRQSGAKAVLVGESLMREENVENALRRLKGENNNGTSAL
ncbi:indole-3-glycerol phosphate synthase TrpC [Alteribacillus sp. HJP-4]|uniref:indole-3-glycerol phosphate synthase TrpC n=1 Tax=Alteribacillus sp. HJP-4 TaxID=2775394 RepID=UPI0035CD087F